MLFLTSIIIVKFQDMQIGYTTTTTKEVTFINSRFISSLSQKKKWSLKYILTSTWDLGTYHNIYILSVVALHESNLHFSLQNIEMSCDLDHASRWSNVNISQ